MDQLVNVIDVPFLNRTPAARHLNQKISDLNAQQEVKKRMLQDLERELSKLKSEEADLSKYLKKLQ